MSISENNFTNQSFDFCAYDEKLKRTMYSGLYQVQTPSNDCMSCKQGVPSDPSLRYQRYGYSSCPNGTSIDDESELRGINYKNSKCNDNYYYPGKYSSNGICNVKGTTTCAFNPQESTRLSNPACNLHGTGINRWNWLCFDPQEHAIQEFEREGTNVRMLFKDNHTPCLEKMMDQTMMLPPKENDTFDPSYKIPKNNELNTLSNHYTYGLKPNARCGK